MKAIIPAIDISNGRCVRLAQGDYKTKKVYNSDPVELAQEYVSYGAKRIHIVDLDAAFKIGNNRALIQEIGKTCENNCVVEVGGGIRDTEDIKALIDMGVHRLCLGTALARDPLKVLKWIHQWGEVFVGAVDVLNGEVQIAGWQEFSGVTVSDYLTQISQIKLKSIFYTNIEKDGMLGGVDMENAIMVADQSHVPVIISGGVGNEEDIDTIMNIAHENIVGVIVGKAIFEGVVNLEQVFKKYPSPPCTEW